MAPPSLVVIDVDGTLAYKGRMDQTPDGPATAGMDAVRRWSSETRFALVSGHSLRNLRTYRDELGIDLIGPELGSLLVENGKEPDLTVPWDRGTEPAEYARTSGLVDAVLDAFPELYDKGTPRTVTVPLKGQVDEALFARARQLVHDTDPAFTLVDNGAGSGVRTLHLGPREISKAHGIRALQARLGIGASQTIMIGDSPQDAACHPVVARVYIVANGDPDDVHAANLHRTKAGYGPGVAEALEAEFGG